MVAAALQILAVLAADPDQRATVVSPWAWDLHRRARLLEKAGALAAAAQARVIARVVSAVALGEISPEELSLAASEVDADVQETQLALDVLASAMVVGRQASSPA